MMISCFELSVGSNKHAYDGDSRAVVFQCFGSGGVGTFTYASSTHTMH
jgi:hypothetical protein